MQEMRTTIPLDKDAVKLHAHKGLKREVSGGRDFCPGKLTLGKILPGKILLPSGKKEIRCEAPKKIFTYIFRWWRDEIELSLKTAGKILSQGNKTW
jgi:hypothetical protein